jgi:aminoglycoside phosphotransferase (APT) family kinase protein
MVSSKMHENEVDTDAALVSRLIAAQFPQWDGLPLERVPSAGTDNALYRLGESMVVRLPRVDWAVRQVDKEQRWLPRLAAHLPLAIPVPLARGNPGAGYPWPWSVYQWLEGHNPTIEDLADAQQAAVDLARFIAALQKIDTAGGPKSGPRNSWRGLPLATRDLETREAITALHGRIDTAAVTAVWEAALQASLWDRPPVWIHGDLQSGNLLAVEGRISAVIDFGCLGVGDPASDVMAAWLFLSAQTRPIFRQVLQVDEATWLRAKGWALSVGLIALPYYVETNPVLAGIARRAIDEVLGESGG